MTSPPTVHQIVSFTKDLLKDAHARSLCLSSFGSLAVRIQTEQCSLLLVEPNRKYKDVDLVSLSPYQEPLHRWLSGLGWQRWEEIFLVTEGQRAVYKSDTQLFVLEIFFDELSFCHRIDLRSRIRECETIPLGDLLLTKLQRIEPRAKDLEDVAALLACRAGEFSTPDKPAARRIVEVLSSDWGFCHTSLKNLSRLSDLASEGALTSTLSSRGIQEFATATKSLMATIDRSPKSLLWRLRSFLGEGFRWYRSVEPLAEAF